MSLVAGIVLLVIAIILFAIRGFIPSGVAQTLATIGAIILAILGILLIILWALGISLGGLGGGGLDLDMIAYQVKSLI